MTPTDVHCYTCDAEPGAPCRSHVTGEALTVVHYNRATAAWTAARRDTEPCPAPGRLEQIQELNAAQESLTRAAAREFYEQVAASAAKAIWFGDGSTVECPHCKAPPGVRCSSGYSKGLLAEWGGTHFSRLDAAKTPAASERAPAIAPEAVAFYGPSIAEMLPRPVCACGQTVWKDNAEINGAPACSDCAMSTDFLFWKGPPAPLDKRIAETKSDDATECAWSTPTGEGEGWT